MWIAKYRFLVDNIPVREVQNTPAMSKNYPSKPMAVYATIWDASDWATHGGKYPVNYKYAPFTASLGQMEMAGCITTRRIFRVNPVLKVVAHQVWIRLRVKILLSYQISKFKGLIGQEPSKWSTLIVKIDVGTMSYHQSAPLNNMDYSIN